MRMMCSWYMQVTKPQLCEKTLYSPVLHRNLLWVVLYILSAHDFNSVPLSLFHCQSQTQHHLLLHLFQLCWWRESVCTRIRLCRFFSQQKSLKSDDTPEYIKMYQSNIFTDILYKSFFGQGLSLKELYTLGKVLGL